MAEAHDQAMTDLRVGVLISAKYSRAKIADQLELEPRRVEESIRRLRAIADQVEAPPRAPTS